MRKKKALKNIFFSLLLELVTVISGFIVPRLIISNFGSSINGMINSITSFIGYIGVLQLGVGSVIKSALYKPLAKKNNKELSIIIKTTDKFFKKIGIATIIYIFVLAIFYPIIVPNNYDFLFTFLLVIIIGIGTIFTYLYGITYQLLLEADQKSYIFSIIQILTIVCNTVLVVLLVYFNFSIFAVKIASTILYVIRPIVLNIYVKKKYKLDGDANVDRKVIEQRWDGFAQGLAYYIHSKTDIFVLTFFSNFINISIYGVYALVTTGLNSLISSFDKSVRATFGNIFANNEKENLIKRFNSYNDLFQILCTIIFSTASLTIFQFVSIYTKNITDANYYQPIFGLLIIAAEFCYCIRMPYNSIIYVAGKFKETKNSAFLEAIINITLSIILVYKFGLVGVAIGTLVAMIYRTIYFIIFLHNNILYLDYYKQIKRLAITFISYIVIVILIIFIKIETNNYFTWFLYATGIFALSSLIVVITNLIFNWKNTLYSFNTFLFKNKLLRKESK